MLEVYKPHTNREAVGVWLCSAAKRPSKRCALVTIENTIIIVQPHTTFVMHFYIQFSNFVGLFFNANSVFFYIVPTPKSNVSATIDHLWDTF